MLLRQKEAYSLSRIKKSLYKYSLQKPGGWYEYEVPIYRLASP